MTKLEKVIKGLECHRIDSNHRINCADCPYYVDDDNHIRCVNDLHDDALALLKEQKAVEPIKKEMVEITARYEFDCSCGAPLLIGQPYCADCGKSVKWDD